MVHVHVAMLDRFIKEKLISQVVVITMKSLLGPKTNEMLRSCPMTMLRLVHQSELGVPVAKIHHFRLRAVETVVSLAQCALPVLPLAVSDTTG